MTITNGYCTLAEFKTANGDTFTTNATDDTAIEKLIEAASVHIRNVTGRNFTVQATDETRYFTAYDGNSIDVGELASVTSLSTDLDGSRGYASTWGATDFDLSPDNAALDGWPYMQIYTSPFGLYRFPVGVRRAIKIVGKFGWPAVPTPIRAACIAIATNLYRATQGSLAASIDQATQDQIEAAMVTSGANKMIKPYVRLL